MATGDEMATKRWRLGLLSFSLGVGVGAWAFLYHLLTLKVLFALGWMDKTADSLELRVVTMVRRIALLGIFAPSVSRLYRTIEKAGDCNGRVGCYNLMTVLACFLLGALPTCAAFASTSLSPCVFTGSSCHPGPFLLLWTCSLLPLGVTFCLRDKQPQEASAKSQMEGKVPLLEVVAVSID